MDVFQKKEIKIIIDSNNSEDLTNRGIRKVVGVSIGSSTRDHTVKVNLLGSGFEISRVGTDGSIPKAIELIKKLDGKVEAIGLGGLDLYFVARGKKYVVRDALKMARAASISPVVDGSGLKNSLERETIRYLMEEKGWTFAGKKVLMTAAVDRFGMAEALVDAKADVIFGDLVFGLKIPLAIRSFRSFKILAAIMLPVVTKLPFSVLYPTGSNQEKKENKNQKYFAEADIIAGDYLFIKKYMPEFLKGKSIITNTTTEDDVKELKERGVEYLVTTTPVFEGRSFGTNVLEATLIAMLKKPVEDVTPEDYLDCLEKLDFKPRVERLN